MHTQYKNEIDLALKRKNHLIPLFSSVLCIPERVFKYRDDFFVVFNSKSERFEIHSLRNRFNTYEFVTPFKALDERTVRHLWKADHGVHGRQIMKDLEESERKFEEQKQKEYRNFITDMALETQSLFAKDAWTEL